MRQLHSKAVHVSKGRSIIRPRAAVRSASSGCHGEFTCAAESRKPEQGSSKCCILSALPFSCCSMLCYAGTCTMDTCQLVLTDAEEGQRGAVGHWAAAQDSRQGPCQ